MLKKIVLLCSGLMFGSALAAFEPIPDRVYFNIGTQHYGMGEDVFGIDGPNEINPGVGFAWEDIGPGLIMSGGIYKDSFSQIAYTGGISYPLFERNNIQLSAGLSGTISFGGDVKIRVPYKNNPDKFRTEIVEPRRYVWPYLNLVVGNAFVQWRPGLNKELEPAGVFSAGLTFRLKRRRN